MSILKFKGLILKPVLIATAFAIMSLQTVPTKEYQVKAVFLFNFAQFVEWPPHAFEKEDTPLIIGVLGEDPFGTFLEEIISNEKIDEHPLVVRYFTEIEAVNNCHILFVSADKIGDMQLIGNRLKSKSVLTVGDTEDFIAKGGAIQFFIEEGKIRLQINLDVANRSDLKISSKLLRLAKIEKS